MRRSGPIGGRKGKRCIVRRSHSRMGLPRREFLISRSEENTSELHSNLHILFPFFFFNDAAPTEIYSLSLHDALPISAGRGNAASCGAPTPGWAYPGGNC